MNIKKSIQCTTEPLEDYILNGGGIDFRLDEESWKDLKVGDHLEYWEDFSGWDKEPQPHARKIIVQLEEKIFASSFSDLIDQLPNSFLRNESKQEILDSLRQWWTPDKESATGVLGMEIKLIESKQSHV